MMMSPGGEEASSGSDTVPAFGFAKGDLDAEGEACDAPRARCDQIAVGRAGGAGVFDGTRRGHRRQAEPTGRRCIASSSASTWRCRSCGRNTSQANLSLSALLRTLPRLGGRLSVTMRQSHAAADKLLVDYAGYGVP